jgi:hypothetical protein
MKSAFQLPRTKYLNAENIIWNLALRYYALQTKFLLFTVPYNFDLDKAEENIHIGDAEFQHDSVLKQES